MSVNWQGMQGAWCEAGKPDLTLSADLMAKQLILIRLGHSQCQHSDSHVQELPGSGRIEILGRPTYFKT